MTVGEHLITLELTGADGTVVVYDKEHFGCPGTGRPPADRHHRGQQLPLDACARAPAAAVVSTSVTKDDMNPYGAFQRAQYAVEDWTRVGPS
jgi:hypothetical protein